MTLSVGNQVLNIPLDQLMPDPSQPRKSFDEDEIKRLSDSIAARGVLQPLRVIRDEQRQVFIILTGESRYRAAKRVEGMTTVPCLLVEGQITEAELLADRLTENDLRNDLSPMDTARAIARLKALKGGCHSKVLVEEYGFSGAAISKAESLLSLPPDIQELVGSGPGQIAPTSAYEISRLPNEASMRELAQEVITKHLPRKAVAEAVQDTVGKRNVPHKAGRLSCKHAGISITVSSSQPLTWAALTQAIEQLKKQAKKLTDEAGKEVATATQQPA